MMKACVIFLCALLLCASVALGGCFGGTGDAPPADTAQAEDASVPAMPEGVSLENGAATLVVYDVDAKEYRQMDLEKYVAGVLAGEMRNDWPLEALKAQAILARTYALKFIDEKKSSYPDADISTDIKEAQAYDESKINERILQAVDETRGQVLSYRGTLPYAWFHAHAGGKTETARAGLDFEGDDPAYIQPVDSPDAEDAPEDVVHWTARFTAEEVGQAAADAGVRTGIARNVEIGEQSESGRATTLLINGQRVSAPAFRIAIGSSRLKSAMIQSVTKTEDGFAFEGKGYGHGVGLSQWGAYGMAKAGESADAIVKHYFQDVDVVRMYT